MNPADYASQYDSFDQEVADVSNGPPKKSKKQVKKKVEEDAENMVFFDFRRGSEGWPPKATLIDPDKV